MPCSSKSMPSQHSSIYLTIEFVWIQKKKHHIIVNLILLTLLYTCLAYLSALGLNHQICFLDYKRSNRDALPRDLTMPETPEIHTGSLRDLILETDAMILILIGRNCF